MFLCVILIKWIISSLLSFYDSKYTKDGNFIHLFMQLSNLTLNPLIVLSGFLLSRLLALNSSRITC